MVASSSFRLAPPSFPPPASSWSPAQLIRRSVIFLTRLCYQLYEEKVKRSSEYLVSREANIYVGSPVLGKRKLEEEFARYRSSRRNFQPRSELDAYLEENFIESENFEILTWWKLNAEKYPVLSAMARDFLAMPLSTVSSESAFSCDGRILGDTRASLKPHALEALVCGKDWLIKVPSNEGPRSEIQVQESDGRLGA